MNNILTMFAGRKRYMEINKPLIEEALDKKIIDEVHVWNFTWSDEDNQYVKDEWGKYIKAEYRPGTNSKGRSYGQWQHTYYPYYHNHLMNNRNDVIIKMDDDVIWFDVDKLEDMIQFRRDNPEYGVVSANVINNGICGEKMNELGILPYKGNRHTWNQESEPALQAHCHYLNNKNLYLNNGLLPIHLDAGIRVQINFIAITDPTIFGLGTTNRRDEETITQNSGFDNAIYTQMIACHYEFSKQTVPDIILEQYK